MIKTSHAIDIHEHPRGAPAPQSEIQTMHLAKRIKAARKKADLTQAEAADEWGVNVRTLQDWELGRNEPRGFARAQLDKLLDGILGASPSKRSGNR